MSESERAEVVTRAAEEGAALFDLDPIETILEVTGPDAEDYLQRMVSCDVRRATADATGGRAIPGTMMTGKGKLIAPFELVRLAPSDGPGFWLRVERSAVDSLAEALERLVILEEVHFARPELVTISVQGPNADALLDGESAGGDPLPSEAGAWVTLDLGGGDGADRVSGLVVRRTRSVAGGWDLVLPRERADAVRAGLLERGAVAVGDEVIEQQRIVAGIPRFGIDATPDNLPGEAGLDASIASNKGCYAGQEVVARIRTYGHVNRRLCLLVGDGTLPTVGTELFRLGEEAKESDESADAAPAKPVGQVTSSATSSDGSSRCIASVRYRHAEVGARFSIGEATATVERVLGE